jgi:4-hydroxy-3-polyprenylbenzoate decarboxylase
MMKHESDSGVPMDRPIVLAITGASGAIYAVRLLSVLLAAQRDVHLLISPAGAQVLGAELDVDVDVEDFEIDSLLPSDDSLAGDSRLRMMRESAGESVSDSSIFSLADERHMRVHYHHYMDFSAGVASGSFLTGGMVICPCSMGTLAGVAHGHSTNLIQRAADVHLKERRQLVLVPRETPLGLVQLENMCRCVQAGALVLPAMPGFYHNPRSIHDLVDFVVGRVCDQLRVQHALFRRWGGGE